MNFLEQIKAFFIALFMPILMLFGWTGGIEVPETKAEILDLYKTAVVDFNNNVPAFEKTNETDLTSENFKVLGIVSTDDTVSDFKGFLNDGKTVVEKVKAGNANTDYLFLKELSEGEIDSVECSLTDDMKYFNVKIILKEEISKGKGLDSLSKITNDYHDEADIKAFLDANGYTANKTEIKLSNITINAKISVDGSRFESLDISFDENVSFTKLVKNKVVSFSSAEYTAKTVISYGNISDWNA